MTSGFILLNVLLDQYRINEERAEYSICSWPVRRPARGGAGEGIPRAASRPVPERPLGWVLAAMLAHTGGDARTGGPQGMSPELSQERK
jgi:hypothetical protein